ncbi:MAG: hypothetical protein AAGD11_19995 [Planctomycetota bacterium]
MFLTRYAILLGAFVLATHSARAMVVIPGAAADPVVDTFGALPAATFGGTGIPNNAVAISTVVDGLNTITLGITATPRFSSPTPFNDGMGAYTAQVGESSPDLSTWNVSYYADIDGPGTFADYRFELDYDLNSAFGTALSDHGTLNLNAFVVLDGGVPLLATTQTDEGSENLGFSFLTTSAPGLIDPPVPTPTFDPFDTGEYTFQLRVFDDPLVGSLVDQVSMSVTVIPEASSLLCFSLVAAIAGGVHWKKQRSSVTR